MEKNRSHVYIPHRTKKQPLRFALKVSFIGQNRTFLAAPNLQKKDFRVGCSAFFYSVKDDFFSTIYHHPLSHWVHFEGFDQSL